MKDIKKQLNEIAGNWNGDDIIGEERALAAIEGLALIQELEVVLKELNIIIK